MTRVTKIPYILLNNNRSTRRFVIQGKLNNLNQLLAAQLIYNSYYNDR